MSARTEIFRGSGGRVDSPDRPESAGMAIGYLLEDGGIYRLRWGEGKPVGRFDEERRVYRATSFGERELGQALEDGAIVSAGLFAGGEAGWVTEAGAVVQAGMIFGEEEIGRVEGPHWREAGAALLLLFYAEEREADHRRGQGEHGG